jgi:hypothetical protein
MDDEHIWITSIQTSPLKTGRIAILRVYQIEFQPRVKTVYYLPTFDGWRALSIGLVILHHSQVQYRAPILGPLVQSLARVGEMGVELFFAISGLLISSRLLNEESRVGYAASFVFSRQPFSIFW